MQTIKTYYKLLLVFCFAIATLFITSCSNNDKDVFIKGDTTSVRNELKVCYDTLSNARPENYTEKVRTDFKSKLDIVKHVLDTENVSEQEVINLNINLKKTLEMFLSYRMEGIPDGALLAGWDFDQVSGTTIDAKGSLGLKAEMKTGPTEIFKQTGLPQLVDDGMGKAISFAQGSHLEIDNYNPSDLLGNTLSFAIWVKPAKTKNGNTLASLNYWNNWKFEVQGNAKPLFTVKTGDNNTTDADNEADQSVAAGKWAQIVVVLDTNGDNKMLFYVNGLLTKEWNRTNKPSFVGHQATAYNSPTGHKLPFLIGAVTTYQEALAAWTGWVWNTPEAWSYYEGLMDNFKIYNIALSSGQVQWLYNQEAKQMKS